MAEACKYELELENAKPKHMRAKNFPLDHVVETEDWIYKEADQAGVAEAYMCQLELERQTARRVRAKVRQETQHTLHRANLATEAQGARLVLREEHEQQGKPAKNTFIPKSK